MKKKMPDWLILCVWRGLLGEIYSNIRAIAISLSPDHTLLIRYYLDRESTDVDMENMEVVATNISAMTGRDMINHIDIECQFSIAPIGKIDSLDGFIYCRKEAWD
ncbi:MAG: hypothetical protein Q7T48_16490 [Cellvibrio sp.]|uniref:hypothetical protein n=1 Tax=Cellvibrio sp. TaxID=1965322 RepID=UPI00272153D5|nr:hypothetical protein [Cellvibrio sp.]